MGRTTASSAARATDDAARQLDNADIIITRQKLTRVQDTIVAKGANNPDFQSVMSSRSNGIQDDYNPTEALRNVDEVSLTRTIETIETEIVTISSRSSTALTNRQKPADVDTQPDGNGNNPNVSDKTDNDPDGTSSVSKGRLNFIKKLVPTSATGKIAALGGIAISSYMLHLIIKYKLMDGARIKIKNIKIEKKGSDTTNRLVTITYDPDAAQSKLPTGGYTAMSPDYVSVAFGDHVNVSNGAMLSGSSDDSFQVKKSFDNKIELHISKTTLSSRMGSDYNDNDVGSGNPYVLDLSGQTEYLYINTSWSNQAAKDIADTLSLVLELFLNSLVQALQSLGPALAAAAGAAGGAAKAGFCATLPIFCDSTIWLLILIGIVAMIIFVAVS